MTKLTPPIITTQGQNTALYDFLEQIYGSVSLIPVQAGNSKDQKYDMLTCEGSRYFLRITSLERKHLFQLIFNIRSKLCQAGCLPNVPVGVGVCPGGCYLLEPWVSGNSLLHQFTIMSEHEQYDMGQQIGALIQAFHNVDVEPVGIASLTSMFERVINRFKKTDDELFGYRKPIISSIERSIHKLSLRPQVLLHGDFHLNNVILATNKVPAIVDFESICMGDSLWDIVSVMDSCRVQQPFSAFNRGLVSSFSDGFLDDEWHIMATYYCLRKLNEYLVFYGRLTDRLSEPSMWEMYSSFLHDPAKLREWLLQGST